MSQPVAACQGRRVSLVQAAQVLFCTRKPTDQQLHRVAQLMKTGALPGRNRSGSPLKWETTDKAVAELMAASHVRRASSGHRRGKFAAHNHYEDVSELQGIYRNFWRDYFMSVFLRKRVSHRSAVFHRTVTATQAVLLLVVVGMFATAISRVVILQAPPEHHSIEQWIADNTDDFAINRWHAVEPSPEGIGSHVRVEYRYRKDSQRWIHTDRTFHVNEEHVQEVALD